MYVVNNITPNGPKFDLNIVVKFDNETQWFDFFFQKLCAAKQKVQRWKVSESEIQTTCMSLSRGPWTFSSVRIRLTEFDQKK